MLPYCGSTEALVWGKRQKIIADSCQEFQEEWWDKPRDKDDHYELFPIPQKVLEQNKYLKQNPGYPDIIR